MQSKQDPQKRCPWCTHDPDYQAYHDQEWGVPEHDDQRLFEKLILDCFQAGLSWLTILKKRPAFRSAFRNFDPQLLVKYGPAEIASLLANPGIVRHRGKIEATINNAKAYLQISASPHYQQSFAHYLWSFTAGRTLQHHYKKLSEVPTSSKESIAMAKSLKAAGFQFCGPTICYAFMQASGMVNDHLQSCYRHQELL